MVVLGPPAASPTPQAKWKYIIFGQTPSDACLITDVSRLPSLPQDGQKWPIIVVSHTQKHTREIAAVAHGLDGLQGMSAADAIKTMSSLPWDSSIRRVLLQRGNFYPVMQNANSLCRKVIFTKWADAYHTLTSTEGHLFTKRDNLLDAISFLLFDGEGTADDDDDTDDTDDTDDEAGDGAKGSGPAAEQDAAETVTATQSKGKRVHFASPAASKMSATSSKTTITVGGGDMSIVPFGNSATSFIFPQDVLSGGSRTPAKTAKVATSTGGPSTSELTTALAELVTPQVGHTTARYPISSTLVNRSRSASPVKRSHSAVPSTVPTAAATASAVPAPVAPTTNAASTTGISPVESPTPVLTAIPSTTLLSASTSTSNGSGFVPLKTVVVPLKTNLGAEMVISYVRDADGVPTGLVLVNLDSIGIQHKVHSLGPFLDYYMDCFGHCDDFIERMFKARAASNTCADFVDRLQPHPAHEAEWYWNLMEYPVQPVHRIRVDFPKPPAGLKVSFNA